MRDRSGEIFVATPDGSVHRCRTIRARPPTERWNAERVMAVRDSVARAVYEFGRGKEDDSDNDIADVENEPDEQEPDTQENEDRIADLFRDSEDENEVDQDAQPDDDMQSETDSNPDPNAMNLLEDIKQLEMSLSKERLEENQRIIMLLATGADVTEVFSPPRVASAAAELGLIPGSSLDLKTGWDFSKQQDRRRAIDLIKAQKPFMIIGSPPCTMFSVLQGLNQYKNGAEWNESFQRRKQEAIRHVEFCAALYRLQSASGRYWLHEHPNGASSWNLKTIAQLLRLPGVTRVRADQCAYGLTASVRGESRPAMKPTGFLTNSWCVARELTKRCPGNHKHFSLMEGRAKLAEQYPKKLCQAICKGVSEQKTYDKQGTCCSKALNALDLERIIHDAGRPTHWKDKIHRETKEEQELAREVLMLSVKNGDTWAWDDVSGASLPIELVKEARRLEIEYVRKMGVYTKVHKSAAKGHKAVGLR